MGNGTSIGKVRGLGSAHHGAHHWVMQRFTAVGNLVTVIFLAVSLLMTTDYSYGSIAQWAGSPLPAFMLALLVISTFWHARLGLQVLIEDYLHDHGTKFGVIMLLNLVAFAGTAFGLFCIGSLAFGGAA